MTEHRRTYSHDTREAELRAQHAALQKQIPLMYGLIFINVVFLSIVTRPNMSPIINIGVPALLSLFAAVRAGLWLVREQQEFTLDRIRRHMRGTLIMAAVLSGLFGGWGLLLFAEADPVRSTSVALYVFVGSISCCYCLQALPAAGRLVLLFGALPVTARLLLSQDWYLVGIGLTFILVSGLIMRTLSTSRDAFLGLLRSRSAMSSLLGALQQSEEHHRYSVELNPQIPWLSDPSGTIVELSPRWGVYTGIAAEEGLGVGWTAAVHPEDLPRVVETWNAAVASGDGSIADMRYRLRCADGSFRWVRARANPSHDSNGEIVTWYGNLEDIHEQVTTETALRESEERYRLAARATNDIIWEWSHFTDQIKWAEGVDHVFGYPAAQGTTMQWWQEHIHPDDVPRVRELYARVENEGLEGWSHEYRFRRADDTYIVVFSRGYVIRDIDGSALRSIGAMLDATVAKSAEDELRWAAYHDPLTDLPNRKLFGEQLEDALAQATKDGSCVGVIVVDIDGFKSINDNLGHAAGDAVLTIVSSRIVANLPNKATVSRLGGDEFAIILTGLNQKDACAATVNRILNGVGEALTIEDGVIDVSLSAGAAMWPVDATDVEGIVKCADLALYEAKAIGSSTVCGFTAEMRERREDRSKMLRHAREALRDDRIIPFYQPKISLTSGLVVGFEALLRWHHHGHGLQPPHALQAAFQDSLLSPELTDRMIDRVLTDMTHWVDEGLPFGTIAINGSSADFRRGDFADRILSRFHKAGLPPSLLELEVTETVFLGQMADTVERALQTLASEGVTIALDDFGTGFASLTHLQQFPVNVLKIDRSFISSLDSASNADFAIVQGIIEISRRMNIKTVAEGVENEAQAARLRELGCDVGQGFLFSRPIAATRVPNFLNKRSQMGGQLALERDRLAQTFDK